MNSNRRQFLMSSAAAAGASLAAGSSLLNLTHLSGAPVIAADPPARMDGSLLKLSLAGYSFSRLLPRRGTPEEIAAAKMTLEDFIRFCAEQQLGAVELTGYYFPKTITTEYLVSIRSLTHRLGLTISGTAIGNDFCLPEGDARQKQLDECRAWIDYAAILGATVIRIFAGQVPAGDTEEAAVNRCAAGINECLDYAEKKGVYLALENHGGITATPGQMLKIIALVRNSPFFGVNFDSGNFQTDDPYRDLEMIAPYAVNAQIKVSVSVNGVKEAANLERIVRILRDAKYRGFVALEYEEDRDPFEAIPAILRDIRRLTDG